MKVLPTVIAGVVIGVVVLIFGIRSCVQHIARRLDCEEFNIDNIELRTETDIPDLSGNPVCFYDTATKIKSNFFIIDTMHVDMKRYVQRNKFMQITAGALPVLRSRPDWNTEISRKDRGNSLYSKKGTYIGEESGNMDRWLYILDSTSGEMWMEVIRTKHH